MSIREDVALALNDHCGQAAINQHYRNVHTLYAMPDGQIYWSEEVSSNSWDVLSGTLDPVAVLYQTGCGGSECNCEDCGNDVDPADWAYEWGGELLDDMHSRLNDIPLGYFEDEK